MNRDVLTLLSKYWSNAHCAYYRHVCKTWASWLGVFEQQDKCYDLEDEFVPFDDAVTLSYVAETCRWVTSSPVDDDMDDSLLAEGACNVYRFMIRINECKIPDEYRLAQILPLFNRPVYEMFDFMFKLHFWKIILSLRANEKTAVAEDLMNYYGKHVEYKVDMAWLKPEWIRWFYIMISKYYTLSDSDKDVLQAVIMRGRIIHVISCVEDMQYVSRDVCDFFQNNGKHDKVDKYCKHHTRLKRIKLST